MAAGSPQQHAAPAAHSGQRASPAPLSGADPREKLLCVLELCGRALLEQHEALGCADGWVRAAGAGGSAGWKGERCLGGLKTGSALEGQQKHGKSSWWEIRKNNKVTVW